MLQIRTKTRHMFRMTQTNMRMFFGLFKQSSNQPNHDDSTNQPETAITMTGQTFNKNKNRQISTREARFEELRLMREKQDKERHKKEMETELYEGESRKEADVTLRTLDLRTIILVNQKWDKTSEFKTVNEFNDFLDQLEKSRTGLTEANAVKIMKGYIDFAEGGASEFIKSIFFNKFLEHLEITLSYFSEPSNFRLAARFMDLYCVDKPSLWHVLETQILAKKDKFVIGDLIEIVLSFSNQGEGTEMLFDTLEVRMLREMRSLSMQQLVDMLVSYFNRKMGRKEFLLKMLTEIIHMLKMDVIKVELEVLRKLSLVISELDELFDPIKVKLFDLIEERIIRNKPDLKFEDCCLFSKAFGFDFITQRLLRVLDAISEDELPRANFEQIRLYIDGFLLTYKISNKSFAVLDEKLPAMLPSLSLVESVRIAKAYYMLGFEKQPLVQLIEQKVLMSLYNEWETLEPTTLFDIVHSYCLTRLGSRELYRVIELVLSQRLHELGKDRELIQRLIAIYRESGMCTHQFLDKLKKLE